MTPITDPNLIAQLEGGSQMAPSPQGATGGMTPVNDPALIAQLEGGQQAPASNPSLPLRLSGDVVAGLASGGQGIHNFLSNALSPVLGKYTPAPTNINFSQLFGVNNPGLGDRVLQGAAQYAPLAPTGDLGLLPQALLGSGYGATQAQNPVAGAAIGGLTNFGAGALSKGVSALPGAATNFLSQYAAKGLAKNVGADLNSVRNTTNQQAFDLAKNNYQRYVNNESNAWDNLTNAAQQADSSGAQFDNSGYLKALSNKLQDLQGQSTAQSGYARANNDAQSLLQGYMGDQHGTFTDAIQHNKALNQDYQNEITPGKSLPFNIVNYAKGNVKQAIDNNINANGLQDTLGSAWNNANAATAQKNQIFNQVVNPGGNQQISTFSKLLKSNNVFQDPTTFVNDYLPKARGDGTQKMQQFAQMLGDEDQAKNILKANYFDKGYSDSNIGIKPADVLNRYNSLSSDQQNYLFTPQQNQTIQGLSKVLANHPSALNNSNFLSLWHSSLPALAGAAAGHATGFGGFEGAAAGMLGAKGAEAGLTKLFEHPAISNYFSQQLTQLPQQVAQASLSSALARTLPPSMLTNQFGGNK